MIQDPEGVVLALFAAFCRIGGCILVLPGFSTARIPTTIRVLLALTVTMALLPVMWDQLYPRIRGTTPDYLLLATLYAAMEAHSANPALRDSFATSAAQLREQIAATF